MTEVSSSVETQAADAESMATSPKKRKVKLKLKLKRPRQNEMSTVGFPYLDLDNAVGVARAVLDAGGVALTRDQLAGAMKLTSNSGNFILKVGSARNFGLIENVQGKYQLTQLGFAIVDKDERRVRAAKAEAFMAVQLYRRVYEEFRGKQLPPRPHGLEQAFVRFGVAPKQRDKARQAFDKSAAQAGFFAAGNDRLVEPILPASPDNMREWDKSDLGPIIETQLEAEGELTPPNKHHPFIAGLIQTLPAPGTEWRQQERDDWLQVAASIFKLIYKLPSKPKSAPSEE